jgi:hypothetical protein
LNNDEFDLEFGVLSDGIYSFEIKLNNTVIKTISNVTVVKGASYTEAPLCHFNAMNFSGTDGKWYTNTDNGVKLPGSYIDLYGKYSL